MVGKEHTYNYYSSFSFSTPRSFSRARFVRELVDVSEKNEKKNKAASVYISYYTCVECGKDVMAYFASSSNYSNTFLVSAFTISLYNSIVTQPTMLGLIRAIYTRINKTRLK